MTQYDPEATFGITSIERQVLYEVDAPENLFDPSLGEDRLPLQAGREFAGRHFARLQLKAEPRR